MRTFKKILVANRGEIAIRVMRAANEIGLTTVAVFAEEDKLSLHRFKADEAYRIGKGMGPIEAYLCIPEIIRIALMSGADALHPGYGFLSENPDLVEACHEKGIVFVGPEAETMRLLGDKATARKVAQQAGVPVLPASDILPDDIDQVRPMADSIGYPVMLKASWGGGGRGMRAIASPDQLLEMIREGRRESEAAVGSGEVFLEKMITRARHVEVQILGDGNGNIYHLFERDCTVQRRNQKIVERAPAPYLDETQRQTVCDHALKIARHVNYCNAGTVEFLMDMDTGEFYFIEVNPRIQVEHTVTEEITGIDIVRAQILIAAGATVEVATGVGCQEEVSISGHAIQSRITTEDPQNNFIPDYGRLTAYRAATGIGIRLDGGTAYSGGVITRHYDSLLVKITAWGRTDADAMARMDRALREFRVRGVATNIVFIENLLKHPAFKSNTYTTRFIDTTPELFEFTARKDSATKLLTYIADVTVNGHPDTSGTERPAAVPDSPEPEILAETDQYVGAKQILDESGPKAVAAWVAKQSRLLVTDTTMRDGHQSLLATRMRSVDMVNIAPTYSTRLQDMFSVECWGGATFDVAYRFLLECPWQRLRDLRTRMPNMLLQMLLRASNAVGYTNYPDNVVRFFVRQAARTGVDLFRVFDSLNWTENMRVAIDAVLETGKICEASICYTGDILNPDRAKYDLDYYVSMARELRDAGTHILGLKDMAGLIKPDAAHMLVRHIKEETGLPVHFHTHDTSGLGAASVLAAAHAGADVVDASMDAFSGGTSQPSLGSIVEALRHSGRDTGLDIDAIRDISHYWESVRSQYQAFDSGITFPSSEVYLHEMPGGQITNLKAQASSMGLGDRWPEIARAYADANMIMGDVVKVTPTSKVVGDLALMMVSQGITREHFEDADEDVAFPDSVHSMVRGNLGRPPGGFPDSLIRKVLKGKLPIAGRPGAMLKPADLEVERRRASESIGDLEVDDEDLCGYLMYPKVYMEYMRRHAEYGPVRTLPTRVFFHGMELGEEISVEIETGKTLEILLQAIGETNEEGDVRVFFELNGQPRVIRVPDRRFKATEERRTKADENDPTHVGAPMPGQVSTVAVNPGEVVDFGDLLLTIEAMKMETGIYAERAGTIAAIHVKPGVSIESKDLLIELSVTE